MKLSHDLPQPAKEQPRCFPPWFTVRYRYTLPEWTGGGLLHLATPLQQSTRTYVTAEQWHAGHGTCHYGTSDRQDQQQDSKTRRTQRRCETKPMKMQQESPTHRPVSFVGKGARAIMHMCEKEGVSAVTRFCSTGAARNLHPRRETR